MEGLEDDSIRNETCCPSTIINIIKVLLCLTDTSLYILSTIRHEITFQRPVGAYQYSAPIRLAFVQQDYKVFRTFLYVNK